MVVVMPAVRPRIVFTVLDAFPNRHLDAESSPTLFGLATAGGWARSGVTAVMASATYPNHATFATGAGPLQHGIVTNWVPRRRDVRPAWKLGPRVPTLFDACRAGGRSTAAVFGDQHLVGVTGATRADAHWPTDGKLPAGVGVDAHGYAEDRDTIVELEAAVAEDSDFLFCQLNGPDTAAHCFGPDSDEAIQSYRDVDTLLARVRDALAPRWDDTLWIVVSDHDQEDVTVPEVLNLQGEATRRGLDLMVVPEGSAAVVCGDDPTEGEWLSEVDDLVGTVRLTLSYDDGPLDCRMVWARPGREFGFDGMASSLGTHGGPRTRTQVGVVSGGHPVVQHLAPVLARGGIEAADWAPTIADLLEIDLPDATGRSLL
jgi:arylsulfatase A-like enzyme